MKSYIDFNTGRRKEATNEADKNLFKLLNNAVYRKSYGKYQKKNQNKNNKNTQRFS